jgi:peptidoglycan/LPS O-acetylase OafA/YrhL
MSHISEEIWTPQLPKGLFAAFTNPIVYGRASVCVFIVLSGYSLMLPVARNANNANRVPQGTWGFYWRRARRILPPYYLAVALSLALIWLLIGHKAGTAWENVTWQELVEHLLLLQDLSHTNPAAINPAYWSIAMECQIYVLFPALVALWRRYHPLFVTVVITIGSWMLAVALAPTWIGQTPGYLLNAFAPQFIGLFAMGMFAASALHTSPSFSRWTRLRAWRFWEIVSLGCAALVILGAGHVGIVFLDPMIGIMTVGLLLACSRPGRNILRTALSWRPLVWIGGISYSLYLIHVPLLQVVWQYALHPLGLSATATYLALLVVGLPLTVLCAWGFWYACERPFLSQRQTPLTSHLERSPLMLAGVPGNVS